MSRHRHSLRERLFHGHSDNDPYDYHNWPVSPLGGNRPVPIPPTPTDSSTSTTSGDERASGTREKVRRLKNRVRSKSAHKHHHHHHQQQEAEKVVIEDEPMNEDEKLERMGVVRRKSSRRKKEGQGHDGDGEAGGVRLSVGSVGSIVDSSAKEEGKGERAEGREERRARRRERRKAERRREHAEIESEAPLTSAPVITTTPATPIGDPHASVHKRRSSTQPLPTSTRTSTNAQPLSTSTSTSSLIHTVTGPIPADVPAPLFSSRQRFPPPGPPPGPPLEMPPYPDSLESLQSPPPTMRPSAAGQDYMSRPEEAAAAPIHRLPTVLRVRAGGKHEHTAAAGPGVPTPPQEPVEIGEGRELRRTDSLRNVKPRKPPTSSSSSPLVSSSSPSAPTTGETSPVAPRPTSYRDSILSTFSYHSHSSSPPSSPPTPHSSPLSRTLSLSAKPPPPYSSPFSRTLSLSAKSSLTPATPTTPAARRPSRTQSTKTENYFSILRSFNTIFLIDDSPSMLYESRWTDTAAALSSIASIATQYDPDGIDIHFLNSPEMDKTGVKTPDAVIDIFNTVRPLEGGSTPLGARLDEILRGYLDRYSRARDIALSRAQTFPSISPGISYSLIKPLNIVVLTDGDATDDPESVIVSAARELDRLNAPLAQVGIQLFQVGEDREAEEFLRGLDDDLVEIYGIRDMVDTTPYRRGEGNLSGEEVLKVLVGAVNRRIDRRENVRG